MARQKIKFITWNQPLGEEECPYVYRWIFNFYFFSIRIHKWIRSDDKRFMHDHPWWFIAMVIRGSNTDVSNTRELMKPFRPRYRSSSHKHYVDVPKSGCISILLTGKPMRKFRFWDGNKSISTRSYFKKHGHPACSEQ